MLKEKIKIIKIDSNYIEYLRKFDLKVQFMPLYFRIEIAYILFTIHLTLAA